MVAEVPTEVKLEVDLSFAIADRIDALIKKKGYSLVNADCTILLQKPKVAPYIIPMRECLAGVLGVEVDRISVKATTTEGAGFVGREEAIAVYATVLLQKNM